MKTYQHLFALITCSLVMACGPSGSSSTDDNTTKVDAGPNESCVTGESRCIGQAYQTCNAGTYEDSQTCSAGQICTAAGCQDCLEGSNVCVGNEVHECVSGGVIGDAVLETCSGGLQCSSGGCVDLCKEADENASYIGCEYWAVDLDNAIEVFGPVGAFGCSPPFGSGGNTLSGIPVCYDGSVTNGLCEPGGTCSAEGFTCQTMDVCGYDAQHSAFAVVVSNPQRFAVNVTISNGAGVTKTAAVAAGAVKELYPQQMGFPDQSIDGSGVTTSAYKITSDAPIVAYQFNPLDNEDVFSNDGSLLIPRSTFDSKYYALTWPTLNRRRLEGPPGPFSPNPTNDYNGYLTVVAWEDNTEVTITPSANVRLGTGFAALAAGTPRTITLNAYETLNLESGNTDAAPEQDLTGTLVEATNGTSSFAVFAGHEAVIIQNTPQSCCADHVEEMMFPASTWGEAYAIARSASRGQNEPDLLRIMAQADGTTVTIVPAGDTTCPTLNAGEHCDVKISGDHTVTSTEDKPILVGHFLLSVMVNGQGDGDPALALAVPTEQFRRNYTFLAPAQYTRQYVSVVSLVGSTVALDGANVSDQFTAFADGTFQAARIEVQPGQHSVECSAGCGIEIYGYSEAVSYLFAGGLDLQKIFVD